MCRLINKFNIRPIHLKLFILIGSLVGTSLLLAQSPVTFRHLSKKEGLSQSSVFAITQDDSGFLWFGTRDGLNKYDGYQFTTYHHTSEANSLISNDIRTLYFDKKMNTLWVGTTNGLCRFRPDYGDFINYKQLTEVYKNNLSIRTFFRDSKDRLWVGTDNGLFLYKDATNTFIRFAAEKNNLNTLSGNDVKVIHETSNGTLWFGSGSGLDTLEINDTDIFKFGNVPQSKEFPDRHMKALLEDEAGNFWIGTQNKGLFFWNRQTDEINVYETNGNNPNSVSNNNVRAMTWGKEGIIWIGTFNGLNRLTPNQNKMEYFFHNPSISTSLSHSSVRALLMDDRNSLWVGTFFGGISFLDETYNRFTNFRQDQYQNSISNNIVSCFTADTLGNWWIGTEGGGLNYYNRKTKEFKVYQHDPNNTSSIASNNIKHLLLEGNQLWISTFNGGLNLMNLNTKQVQRIPYGDKTQFGTTNNNVYRLYKKDDWLWSVMHGGGLDVLNFSQQKRYNYVHDATDSTTISSNLARTFLVTKTGEKWIGTDNGLNKVIEDSQGLPIAFERHLSNKKIYTLKEDAAENIWVGTLSNGLYKLHKDSTHFENFNRKDGLPGHSIFGILEDDNYNLWISTNNGISQFNPIEESFTNYNYSDGLDNTEFNFNAYYKTNQGEMLFGGMNGFTLFNPKDISPSYFISPIVLTKLKVQNQEVKVQKNGILTKVLNETSEITLPYNNASFSIAFASLDYFNPENITYSYKLEGLDENWVNKSGQSEATYTIQNAGNYLFRLKAKNSDGIWNPTEKQLNIKVLPPPWKSPLAYFIYFLVLIGLGLVTLRLIRLRHHLRLEQVTKQKQQELHELKVRFFTNITHEFRTPLTLILGQIQDLTETAALGGNATKKLFSVKKNTNRLLNLVNQLLTFRKLETDHIQIRAEKQNVVTFLEEIMQSFKDTALDRGIDLSFNQPNDEILIWFDRDKLEKVFYNLLSNAFKFTDDGGEISLSIEQQRTAIIISLKDNGKGIAPEFHEQVFKRFYESDLPIQRTIKGSGIGLAISKQMVDLHAGEITLESEKGKGATFSVKLPFGNKHFKASELINTPQNTNQSNKNSLKYIRPTFPKLEPVPTPQTKKPLPKDALKLLIVEDNEEILDYIQSIFVNEYKINTAPNGKIGFKSAIKFQPDLIISDIAMPEMDGLAFCNLIKKDLQTSHIPVILLTANVAQEIKIDGLEIGADDYITKPFDAKELKLRVKNIANARINLRNKFSRILNLSPTEITVTSADEEFLKNAMDIVEKHIENTNFGVVQFAQELAVSRPLLFTKLKGITNQTPNNFIKSIRLKRAAQLLKQRKINVAEVAYKVGFKDPRYFSKCFQKEFQKTPTQFMGEH